MSKLLPQTVHQFTEDYKRLCFQFWYSTGCKYLAETWKMEGFPEEDGNKVALGTLRVWMNKYMWVAQADSLNARAIIVSDDILVKQKAEMLKRQAQDAFDIAMKAKDHLLIGGFDSSAAAVNAYFRGTEEERKAKGIGEVIERLVNMTNDQLKDEILRRVGRASDSEVVEEGLVRDIDTESKEEK